MRHNGAGSYTRQPRPDKVIIKSKWKEVTPPSLLNMINTWGKLEDSRSYNVVNDPSIYNLCI